jgi:hypothetical protein
MNEYIQRVIEFTEEGLASHEDYATIAFDPGMQARVIDMTQNGEMVTVELDMSEFVKHNSKHMQPNWEDRSGQRILKWNQTPFYPLRHKLTLTFYKNCLPFELR